MPPVKNINLMINSNSTENYNQGANPTTLVSILNKIREENFRYKELLNELNLILNFFRQQIESSQIKENESSPYSNDYISNMEIESSILRFNNDELAKLISILKINIGQ
jgi:hypothetical protein